MEMMQPARLCFQKTDGGILHCQMTLSRSGLRSRSVQLKELPVHEDHDDDFSAKRTAFSQFSPALICAEYKRMSVAVSVCETGRR